MQGGGRDGNGGVLDEREEELGLEQPVCVGLASYSHFVNPPGIFQGGSQGVGDQFVLAASMLGSQFAQG